MNFDIFTHATVSRNEFQCVTTLISFVPDFKGSFEPPGGEESLNMETVKI